jgi:hypothetical protein
MNGQSNQQARWSVHVLMLIPLLNLEGQNGSF